MDYSIALGNGVNPNTPLLRFQENSCYLMGKVVLLKLKFTNCLLDYEEVFDIEH